MVRLRFDRANQDVPFLGEDVIRRICVTTSRRTAKDRLQVSSAAETLSKENVAAGIQIVVEIKSQDEVEKGIEEKDDLTTM